MPSSEYKTSDILLHTQEMMINVIEGQWDQLLAKQSRQDLMIKQIFFISDKIFSEREQEELEEVKRLNQEILKATETHRNETAKKLRDMRRGKTKAQAYQAL